MIIHIQDEAMRTYNELCNSTLDGQERYDREVYIQCLEECVEFVREMEE
jgi:hypothetical protein